MATFYDFQPIQRNPFQDMIDAAMRERRGPKEISIALKTDEGRIFTRTTNCGCPGRSILDEVLLAQARSIEAIVSVGLRYPCPQCLVLLSLSPRWERIRVLRADNEGMLNHELTLKELKGSLQFTIDS